MGLLISVVVVCTGTLVLMSVLSSSAADEPGSDDLSTIIVEVLDDGTLKGTDGIPSILNQTMEDPKVHGVALDILPLVPDCERVTYMSGEPSGTRNTAVMLCMMDCENGEMVPCRATLTVWEHA